MIRTTTLAVLALSQALLVAQRDTPSIELQKRSSVISYGAVPLGKHSLAELQSGATWRLGMNTASTWRTEMPVLVGDQVLAPGEYRIQLQRLSETRCAIEVHGSALATGGSEEVQVEAELRKEKKKAKKLRIEWRKDKARAKEKTKSALPALLRVHYGEHSLAGAVTILGGKDTKLGKHRLTVFAVPAKLVAARKESPVPIAVIHRGKGKSMQSWCLVLDGDEAVLRPWMVAPTTQHGFGEVVAPSAARTTTGEIVATTREEPKGAGALELLGTELRKQDATLQLAAGKELLAVSVAIPGKSAKK